MTWIDSNGDVRPQSWEEYLSLKNHIPAWAGSGQAYQPLHSPIRADGKISKIRRRLFRADPHCFWCGRTVFLNVTHATPSLATIDHLYSRLHPHRAYRYREQSGVLHVLACYECNHRRGVCEQRKQPFIPALPERLEFARLADATLAGDYVPNEQAVKRRRTRHPAQVRTLKEGYLEEARRVLPMRVIQTLEEAVEYAKENPAR